MKTEKWYSYESMDAITMATTYVSIREKDAIAIGKTLRDGATSYAALEAFISTYNARLSITPGYLAVPSPGALLREHIVDLGANGMQIFSAQVGIKPGDLLRMTEDKDVIIPKHVLKRIGLRREMVAYPLASA